MKKKGIIIAAVGVVVLAALGIFFLGSGKEEGYRMMQVYQVSGKATIERENVGTMDAFENLNLLTGDMVDIATDSYMRLKVDEDKFVLAEAGSLFKISATGSADSGRTDIQLEKGSLTVEVQNKLSDDASFEVTTPNSVMAVRGTVFRISTDVDEAGESITKIAILEGEVSVQYKDENGDLSEEQIVDSGCEAIIYKDAEDFKIEILDEISFTDIPVEVLEFLQEIAKERRELVITSEEIKELIENQKSEGDKNTENTTYTVTFTYQGKVFATQVVEAGETAKKPTLMPAKSGNWNFDFSTPIEEDIIIEFLE